MRVLLQRVTEASVTVNNEVVGSIKHGWLVFVGAGSQDDGSDAEKLADKIINLRLFSDHDGKFNHSILDVGGSLLVVSQFTLYADCRQGRRPSFTDAAPPVLAKELYEKFVAILVGKGLRVETGIFAADMKVQLINDGPVTIWLDSKV